MDKAVDNGVNFGGSTRKRSLLLLDGDCGFCQKAAEAARSTLFRSTLTAAPFQRVGLDEFGLTPQCCEETLHVIDPRGGVRTGSDAVAEVLLASRFPWPLLGRALYLPGLRRLAQGIYARVARNRHRLPGGSAACRLSSP